MSVKALSSYVVSLFHRLKAKRQARKAKQRVERAKESPPR